MSIVKEFVEKLAERLEEYKYTHLTERDSEVCLHCTETNCGIGEDCCFCVIDKAKEIVNELAEEYNSNLSGNLTGWIPCSERLPDAGRKYLVMAVWKAEDFRKYSVYIFVYGSDGLWHSYNYEPVSCEVVAWQSLPETYEQEQQKEIPTSHYEERFNRMV